MAIHVAAHVKSTGSLDRYRKNKNGFIGDNDISCGGKVENAAGPRKWQTVKVDTQAAGYHKNSSDDRHSGLSPHLLPCKGSIDF